MISDCTVVTALYNLQKYHNKSLSYETCMERFNVVLELPVYLVIFTENEFINYINEKRSKYGFSKITLIIDRNFKDLEKYKYLEQIRHNRTLYHPSKDERTSAESHLVVSSKSDFLLETMDLDPFHTSKFVWMDSLLGIDNKMRICENYTIDKVIHVLDNLTEKFHIQILNVNDKKFSLAENKREYYGCYRYVVCGCVFGGGKKTTRNIMKKLNDSFISTTNLGFGHGEEMLFLEILTDNYDDIERGYGDYGQIINNILYPTCNFTYIYQCIIQGYLNIFYHRECYDCCVKTLYGIEKLNAVCDPHTYLNILFAWYLSTFYYKKDSALEVIQHIYNVCESNSDVKHLFELNKTFFESQFTFAR